MKNLKDAILIFEKAANTLFEKMQEGRDNLKDIGKERNVVHLKDITANNEFTEDSLLATQIIPGVMLLSFVNELAIKQIYYQDRQGQITGHSLSKLFSQLKQSRKENIISRVKSELNIDSDEFNSSLGSNSSGFIDWRYFYENTDKNFSDNQFLSSLLKSLKKEILW